jgi:membrane associated rhomboid family serine protease
MFPIRDTIPRRSPPIATWLIILANIFVFMLELGMSEYQIQRSFYLFGIVPARFTHPEWAAWVGFPIDEYWPFFTSMFLHGGWLHIISNMWTLWIFGDNVEDRMGPVRFLIFYLLCGVSAGIVHTYTQANSVLPAVGASGAIAGVMGAYFFLFPLARIIVMIPVFIFPFFFELPAILYLGFWALTQLFSGTLALAGPSNVGGIAWWAHVGGFATGLLLQLFFVRRGFDYRLPARDEVPMERAWIGTPVWRIFP